MVDYRQYPVPAHLAPWVSSVWTLQGRFDGPQRVLPDGCIELIVHLGEPMMQNGVRQARRLIAGQMDRCLPLEADSAVNVAGVRFHPHGAAAFFRMPMHLLTNRMVDAGAALGDGFARRFADLAEVWIALEERLRGATLPNLGVAHAVRQIIGAQGRISMDRVAESAGVGPRHLDRLFRQEVGLTPKLFAQILRFQNVFAVWESGDLGRFADLAVECGFYDQAHLCHEFARFAGRSPSEFFERPEVMARLFLRDRGCSQAEACATSDSYKR